MYKLHVGTKKILLTRHIFKYSNRIIGSINKAIFWDQYSSWVLLDSIGNLFSEVVVGDRLVKYGTIFWISLHCITVKQRSKIECGIDRILYLSLSKWWSLNITAIIISTLAGFVESPNIWFQRPGNQKIQWMSQGSYQKNPNFSIWYLWK